MTPLLLDADDLGLGVAIEQPAAPSTQKMVIAEEIPPLPAATALAQAGPATRRRSSPAKSTQRGLLVFDIETIPDYSREELFDLEQLPEMPPVDSLESLMSAEEFISQGIPEMSAWFKKHNPPADWMNSVKDAEQTSKKPRKGAFEAFDEHAKRIQGITDSAAARRKEMSLCPEMNRIVALGWKIVGDKKSQSLVVGGCSDQPMAAAYGPAISEEEILERFWGLAQGANRVIGFNILGFDLPTIFVRSMILGITPSRQFDLKPWGNDCVDLFALRYPKFSKENHGLKWLAKSTGLIVPAGDMDGSQVEEMFHSDPAKLGEYVRSDVDISEAMYLRYRGFFC